MVKTQLDHLLRAVCCDPDDPFVRVVYAEALEENDQWEEAMFLRGKFSPNDRWIARWVSPFTELLGFGNIVLDQSKNEWGVLGRDYHAILRGGFIEEITCPVSRWENVGPELVAMTPLRMIYLMRTYQQRVVPRLGDAYYVLSFDDRPGQTFGRFRTYQDGLRVVSRWAIEWARGEAGLGEKPVENPLHLVHHPF